MALGSKQQDLEDSVLLVEQLDKGNAYFEDQNLKDQQRMVQGNPTHKQTFAPTLKCFGVKQERIFI